MTNNQHFLILAFAVALSAFNTSTAQHAENAVGEKNIIVEENLRYTGSDTTAQTLIIAYHKNTKEPRPAVIHFHGARL